MNDEACALAKQGKHFQWRTHDQLREYSDIGNP
jgi:hypothetical protein